MNDDVDFHIKIEQNPYRFTSISIGGSILSSPFINNDQIYFGCNDTYVYALDLDGNKRWSYKTDGMVFSSPTCYKDYVVVGSMDGFLYCFSGNGDLVWKFNAGGKISGTSTIVDGVVYFGANNGLFYALSIEDGKEVWRYQHVADILFMSPGAVNDTIISGHMNGDIFCLSKDGKLLWKTQTGDHSTHTPLIIDAHEKELCSFRKRSLDNFPTGENCKVYMGSGDGYFRCLDASDGRILWKVFSNRMGSSSPNIFDKHIFYGSMDGNIYCVNLDGILKWKFHTFNKIVPSPAVANGAVYCGSSDHNLYALDTKNGNMLWRFLTDGELISSPVVNHKKIFFGSWDGNMYAMDLKTRELLWKFKTAISTPSYIRKPEIQKIGENQNRVIRFDSTSTTHGYNVKSKNYSSISGELTNHVYTSPVSYKGKKPAYDFGTGPYKR